MSDFLAIIRIGGGSSFARYPTINGAVEAVKDIVVRDWSSLFTLKDATVKIAIYDVSGEGDLWWDDEVHTDDGRIIPLHSLVKVEL
jgi:hypothetical protein